MDNQLKGQLIQAMMRFRKIGSPINAGHEIHMGELMVMSMIAQRATDSDKNVNVSDIHDNHHMTKPAISQMFNALEKKGYINREINKNDRRKVKVTLTPQGEDILKKTKDSLDQTMDTLIARFGEDNTRQLIALFTRLADISEDMKREAQQKDKTGDKQLD